MVRWLVPTTLAALLVGCAVDAPSATTTASPPSGCLPSKWPDRAVIDPDAPAFEDAAYTREKVEELFAGAKASSSSAYRAYRAARDHADVLACGFCACGCAADGHLSALDCFKDMHGFG